MPNSFDDGARLDPETILNHILGLAIAEKASIPIFVAMTEGIGVLDTADGRVWAMRLEELN